LSYSLFLISFLNLSTEFGEILGKSSITTLPHETFKMTIFSGLLNFNFVRFTFSTNKHLFLIKVKEIKENIASKIKNAAGLILVDGSRFCDYETYFKVLSNFENSLKQNNYQSLLKNMFSSMFFSESYKKDRDRIVKRAINIPERYSLPLRRNTIWYDSHCVENNLKSLKLPILVIQSTKIDSKNARCMINKDDDIYYVNFINNFNKNNDIVLLENTGHYVTIEKPQWINETILSWLIKLKLHFRK